MKKALNTLLFATTSAALLAASPAMAYEAGDIIFRAGAATVDPNDDSGTVDTLPGSGVEVNSNTQLGLTLTYMYSDHVGLELLAATPFEHDVEGTDSIDGLDIGELKHLPPSLTVNYYPAHSNAKVQPYVGAGINYTYFFDEDADSALEGALGGSTDLELDDSWGLALRAGVDVMLNENWALNAGLWYLDIDTTATLKTGSVKRDVDVDIDPYVWMLGLSYRF